MTASEITITIPAESRFAALARVLASSLAAELDYTVDDIDDLRVGANELVAFLIEAAEDNAVGVVELVFRWTDAGIAVEGAVPGVERGSDEVLDSLTGQILSAVVDEHDVSGTAGRIVKHRTS